MRNTHEECDGMENVSQEQLEGQLVNAEALSNPCHQTIDGVDEGKDSEYVGQNLTDEDQTKSSSPAERVQRVCGAPFLSLSPRSTTT